MSLKEKLEAHNVDSIDKLIEIYKDEYYAAAILQDLDKQDELYIQQEKQWLAEQKAILEAERIANELREAEIASAIARQEEQRRQELELAQKAILQEQKEAERRRREEHKLEVIRRKQEREAQKVQKEVAKRKRHREAFFEATFIESAMDGKTIAKSRYKVSMDIVHANAAKLTELFAIDVKEYRYSDIDALLAPLGGRLDVSTGSSHQRVVFGGNIYQHIKFDEDVLEEQREETHGGIANRTWLRNYNLELLRNAVQSVLPEGWLDELQLKSTVKLKA